MNAETLQRAKKLTTFIDRYNRVLSHGIECVTHKLGDAIYTTELDEITKQKVEEIIKERREEMKKEFEEL